MAYTRTRRRAAFALAVLCAPLVAAGVVIAAAAPAGATGLATDASHQDAVTAPASATGDTPHVDHESDRTATFFFGTRALIVTSDATPTITGRSAPSGHGVAVRVDVLLSGTATDGTKYEGVRCVSPQASLRGTWSCTFTQPLHNGTFALHLTQTVTTKGGTVHKRSATAHLRVEAPGGSVAPPPPPPAPEPKPKPPTTATTPPPAAAGTGAVTVSHSTPPAALQAIAWKFTILDAHGQDVSGQPLEPGEYLVITSGGLPNGATVLLEMHSTPTQLGWAVVGADGALSLAVRVPSDAPAGAHALIATLTAPGIAPSLASVPVTVNPVAVTLERTLAAGPPPGPAPVTPVPAPAKSTTSGAGSGIAASLPTIHDITAAPWKFAASGGLAAAFVLLAALPAELLESTLSENYGRAFGWLTPARKRVSRLRMHPPRFLLNPWAGGLVTVFLASAILGFSEADFGFNAHSARTFLALFLSLFMLNIAIGAIKLSVASQRLQLPGKLMPMPGALLVAASSVLVSRIMHISPSLLFGLVVGVSFARVESKQIEGKLALVAIGSTLALGIFAWLWFSVVVDIAGRSEGFWVGLTEETLAATALESLSVLLVGMLPFHYLEGKALRDWSTRIWAGMYLVCAAVFVFIAVPMGNSWEQSRAPVRTWLTICMGFAVISIAAWAAFHFMPEREEARERESESVGA